jgi:hypothetical protein
MCAIQVQEKFGILKKNPEILNKKALLRIPIPIRPQNSDSAFPCVQLNASLVRHLLDVLHQQRPVVATAGAPGDQGLLLE